MNKKISLTVIGLLLIAFIIISFYEKDMVRISLYDYTILMKRVFASTSLLLLIIFILAININYIPSSKSLYIGLSGFVTVLLIALFLAMYANPHARFTNQKFLATVPTARGIKISLYEKINYTPSIVIMGDSRAFGLSPHYIEQVNGYKTFNFSVEGGKTIDYLWQLEYILNQNISSPQVLIINIGSPNLSSGLSTPYESQITFSFQPLSIVPYISPYPKIEVVLAYLEDIVSMQSVIDAWYLITHPHLTPDLQTWKFEDDGYGQRREVTPEEYQTLLNIDLTTIKNSRGSGGFACTEITESNQEWIKELISKAEKNNIAIIFYQSPVNGTVLEVLIKDEQFNQCQTLLTNFMEYLKNEYPNVQYVDLIDYEPITSLRESGFYDARHLRPDTSMTVMNILIPNIAPAIQWSISQQK